MALIIAARSPPPSAPPAASQPIPISSTASEKDSWRKLHDSYEAVILSEGGSRAHSPARETRVERSRFDIFTRMKLCVKSVVRFFFFTAVLLSLALHAFAGGKP